MLRKPQYINVKGKLLDLSVPRVMGIINITPDSFYNKSRIVGDKALVEMAGRMLSEGADFIDVGGYSSRPGATDISQDEEMARVLPAVSLLHSEFPDAVISVDTFRSGVAVNAVKAGASVINDISAGEGDSRMFETVKELNVPYILMHMKGNPSNMQLNPAYDDVVADILKWSAPKITWLQSNGVRDIIFDPGFGFGKTAAHSFEILNRLSEFSVNGLPLLAGLSRKSMIWRTLKTDPGEALNGTTALNMVALMKGADILRVHDVKEAVEAIKLFISMSGVTAVNT